jgi:hypothetical protein
MDMAVIEIEVLVRVGGRTVRMGTESEEVGNPEKTAAEQLFVLAHAVGDVLTGGIRVETHSDDDRSEPGDIQR